MTQGLHIWKRGDPRKLLGLSASLPHEPGQLGAARAPTPVSVRTAAGLIDALLTTEATQMANLCVVKAAGGAGDCHAALPQDSLRVNGVYYFNVFPLALFLKSIFLAVQLCKRGTSPR